MYAQHAAIIWAASAVAPGHPGPAPWGLIAPLVTEGLPPAPWQVTAVLPGPVGWLLGIGTTVLVLIAKAK
jgi:hypothetical protein